MCIDYYFGTIQAAGGSYDEKADIYSLGIIFFEMWHAVATGMERIEVLNNLREKGLFPDGFEKRCPKQVLSFSFLFFCFVVYICKLFLWMFVCVFSAFAAYVQVFICFA